MSAIQVKLLVAILTVLIVIAGLLMKGGRQIAPLTPQQQKDKRVMEQKIRPHAKRYLVP